MKNFIFTKMCFRISFLKILFSKKMDFVDRKEEQARSLKAIQVAKRSLSSFMEVPFGQIDAHQICPPRY